MENEILDLIDRYWKFDNDQTPVSNWHDKQDLLEAVRKALRIHDVMPRFCFICGTKLMEVGLGWLQCESEQCGEVYLPFIDENNNQCLMHQRTPFSPK